MRTIILIAALFLLPISAIAATAVHHHRAYVGPLHHWHDTALHHHHNASRLRPHPRHAM